MTTATLQVPFELTIEYEYYPPEPDVGFPSGSIEIKTIQRDGVDITDWFSEDGITALSEKCSDDYEYQVQKAMAQYEDSGLDEDEDTPRKAWRRMNPNAPTGTGRPLYDTNEE